MSGLEIFLPIGDPSGIGPEIAVKAAAETGGNQITLVGDQKIIKQACELTGNAYQDLKIEAVAALENNVTAGTVSAEAGRACLAYTARAIKLASSKDHAAVVAAPHNETAIARAGIEFSGYPGFLAEQTGSDPDRVFLMLASPKFVVIQVTLHLALRAALDMLSPDRVKNAALAADGALKQMGLTAPRLAACGINPHAGENGLFGSDDENIIVPALAGARAQGINIDGPFGADVLFQEAAYDGYLAMYHDQGHIPVKLQGRGRSFGMSIGTPVLFATVAHGSAHDIAGQGRADAAALINIINQLRG